VGEEKRASLKWTSRRHLTGSLRGNSCWGCSGEVGTPRSGSATYFDAHALPTRHIIAPSLDSTAECRNETPLHFSGLEGLNTLAVWRAHGEVEIRVVMAGPISRGRPSTPFLPIITIPISICRHWDGDDGFSGVSAFNEYGKGATSILQTVIWASLKHPPRITPTRV
jgi:hypothetical protein